MASFHLRKVFNPETLRRVATETEKIRVELGADLVCVRGLSGTLAASAMGAMFGTPFAVARKESEVSHGMRVEIIDRYDGKDYGDWIIVDDLIDSGATVRAIASEIGQYEATVTGRCKGIVLYHLADSDRKEQDIGGYRVPIFSIVEKVVEPTVSEPKFTALPEGANFDYGSIEPGTPIRYGFRDYASIARNSLFAPTIFGFVGDGV